MSPIYLVTKNAGKLKAAKSVFDKFGIELKSLENEYPEIQADTSLKIAKYTALQAAKENNLNVIREDHSLFIQALGFPGPYTNFIERNLSSKKLLGMLEREKDRAGYFEIATVYATPVGKTLEFVYRVPITIKKKEIAKDPRGGWNGILCLKGEGRAFTEYPEEERLHVWSKNYLELAKLLKPAD